MKKALVILAMIIGALSIPVSIPSSASAAVAEGCSTSFLGLPVWYKYLDVGPEQLEDNNGDLIVTDECAILGPRDEQGRLDWRAAGGYIAIAVIEVMLRLGSVIAVGFVMYAGFRFITSQGEPDNAKAARETMINAMIGLVITIAAASIVSFIANRFG